MDAKTEGFETTVLMAASRGVFINGAEDEAQTIKELSDAGINIL